MSRLFVTIAVAASLSVAFSAHAFGLGDVPGLGKKSATSGSTDLVGSQDLMVKQYVSAGKSVLDGNAKMADAVGLATEAAAARAAADALSDGATKGALGDSEKTTSDTSIAIANKLKNTEKLDGPAKEKFAAGLLSLAQGLGKYVGMKGPVTSFQSGLSSASPMMLPKLQSGAYILTSFPTSVSNLATSLKNAVSYAQSHDIPVPKDATDVMGKL
ncbi:hypothetical protein D3C72_199400 [compost metagenome]